MMVSNGYDPNPISSALTCQPLIPRRSFHTLSQSKMGIKIWGNIHALMEKYDIYIYIMYNHPQVIISGEEKRQRWKIFEVYRSPKCKNYPSPRLSPCFSEIVSPDGPSCLLLLLKALILDEPRHSREFQCCFCSLAT